MPLPGPQRASLASLRQAKPKTAMHGVSVAAATQVQATQSGGEASRWGQQERSQGQLASGSLRMALCVQWRRRWHRWLWPRRVALQLQGRRGPCPASCREPPAIVCEDSSATPSPAGCLT